MRVIKRLLVLLLIMIIILFALGYFILFATVKDNHKPYMELIEKYSQEYGVEKELVAAVIKAESGFNSDAQSHADAKGLMQITTDTGEWIANRLGEDFDDENLYDPETNIRFGVYYLDYLINYYKSVDYAIMAYNAGFGNVDLWIKEGILTGDIKDYENIPFAETKNYVNRVKKQYHINKEIYDIYYTPEKDSRWLIAWNLYKTFLLDLF